MWTSNPEITASFATCALSSDNQHGHNRISALHIFGYAHADYPGRLHYLVSKKDEPLPDKYYDTSALRRRLVSNFALAGWGTRWRGSREVRGNGRSNLHAMEHGWVLSKYRTDTFSWWSFLERAKSRLRFEDIRNWWWLHAFLVRSRNADDLMYVNGKHFFVRIEYGRTLGRVLCMHEMWHVRHSKQPMIQSNFLLLFYIPLNSSCGCFPCMVKHIEGQNYKY